MQLCHEESYRVVAVEGIHPEEWFVFKTKLRKHIQKIESVVPTLKSTAQNNHGQQIGRYNILCKKSIFSKVAKKHHQEFTGLYHQHLQNENKELNGENITQSESHPGFQDQTIHRVRFHPWIVEIPSSLIQHPSSKSGKLIGSVAWNSPQ
jgi:hypothetical protein